MNLSDIRKQYKPKIPKILEDLSGIALRGVEKTQSLADQEQIQKLFPSLYGGEIMKLISGEKTTYRKMKVGVVLSGGQAPGGHNVIAALFDALQEMHSGCDLIGFLNGPSGIINGEYKNLERVEIDEFRNQGGFDIIGSGRTKIESQEQLDKAARVVRKLDLDGLVIIGGDDSNTNAAILAEYFIQHEILTTVVGIPKTIDGDLKNDYVEISFGFDTATKTYSEMIGNLAKDALSAKKYYHFIKLMGRSASHITLECALHTQPNFALISEEVKANKQTLSSIVQEIVSLIVKRSEMGKNYGIVLIPEGLIEFIPEMRTLIEELNRAGGQEETLDLEMLSSNSRALYESLPQSIQQQFFLEKDPHGNIQLSHIQTEKMIVALVNRSLKENSTYKGKFSPVEHFFGYEGRSAFPTNFDANYCYSLGRAAALFIAHRLSGYMVAIKNLKMSPNEWEVFALPITSLLNMETRKGRELPVIQKALVDLHSPAFQYFAGLRQYWKMEDDYEMIGPIQFFGDPQLTDQPPQSFLIKS